MNAVGDILPIAVGVAISPVPIITVILMLGTPRARSTGPAFALGWVLGLVVVSVIVLVVAEGADDADSGAAAGVNWIQVGLGVVFFVMAARQWRSRPARGEEPEMPSWMAAIDTFGAGKALALGAVLSGVNPKNLALTFAAAATIAQAGLSSGESAVAVGVYVLIASVTVVGPVLFALVAARAAAGPLAAIKDFMADHNAVIMMIILVVLGAKLLGSGLAGVSS